MPKGRGGGQELRVLLRNGSIDVTAWGGRGVLCKRAAEVEHLGDAILEGVGTFAKAPGKVLQSLNHMGTLPQSPFGEFLWFMHSKFESEVALKDEANRRL